MLKRRGLSNFRSVFALLFPGTAGATDKRRFTLKKA